MSDPVQPEPASMADVLRKRQDEISERLTADYYAPSPKLISRIDMLLGTTPMRPELFGSREEGEDGWFTEKTYRRMGDGSVKLISERTVRFVEDQPE